MSKAAKGRRPIERSCRRPPRTGSSSKRMSLANAARRRRRRGSAALAKADADVLGDVDDVAAWPLAEADADALGDVEGREGPEADRALAAQAAEDGVLLEACGALGASFRSLARPIIP